MASRVRKLTPADEMRLFAGLAAQPFLATVSTLVVYPLMFSDHYPASNVTFAQHVFAVALYFGVAALVITLACVFPTVVWLVKRRPVSLPLALIFGLAFSNAPVLLATVGGGGGLQLHAFASVLGLIGAAAFWFMSIRAREFGRDPEADRA